MANRDSILYNCKTIQFFMLFIYIYMVYDFRMFAVNDL